MRDIFKKCNKYHHDISFQCDGDADDHKGANVYDDDKTAMEMVIKNMMMIMRRRRRRRRTEEQW